MSSFRLGKASHWSVGGYALTSAGVAGYLIAFSVAIAAWWFVDSQRRALAIVRFGETAAQELAYLAAEPLSRDDRIGLSLAANRMLQRPEISRIAVYTVDDQPFVVIGETALPDAPAHIEQITIDNAVLGDVSVTLDASRFGLPVWRLLADSWLFWLAGLALTVVCCGVADRRRVRPAGENEDDSPSPQPHADHEDETYILVANLFQRPGVDDEQRRSALRRGAVVAERVAQLYEGEAVVLPDAGLLLTFRHTDSSQRGFEAVCAGLLLQRLCQGVGDAVDASVDLFRYGLDLASGAANKEAMAGRGEDVAAKRLVVSDVTSLSSLAPDGQLLIGADAYASVEQPGRLFLKEIGGAAALALSSASVPKGIVSGVDERSDNLLRSQAESIAEAIKEAAR